MNKRLAEFKYMTFDIVGTLIDFERGMIDALNEIAAEAGVTFDPEAMLGYYRAARYDANADRFPDHLAKVYMAIAPKLGLPADQAYAERWRSSAPNWPAFSDSAASLAKLAKTHRLIAMTNAQHWAFKYFEQKLDKPFYAAFTSDITGTEKPNPAFFHRVFDFVTSEGNTKDDILHVAQSQYHDIGISRKLGMTNCWIERRHAQPGYGGTIEPAEFTAPDFHFTSMATFADAVQASAM